MITHTSKEVIYLKDIQSNIIEEAIFILKPNLLDIKSKDKKIIRDEILLSESEEIVKEYNQKLQTLKTNKTKHTTHIQNLRKNIIICSFAFTLICYLISRII